MMKPLLLFTLLVASVTAYVDCNSLNNATRYHAKDLLDCYRTIPLSNEEKESTIQNVKKLLEFYIFKDIVRDAPTPGPFVKVRVNIDDTLETIRQYSQSQNIGAWEFFQMLQDKIFTPLADAHTSIEKPTCFLGAIYQPFSFSGTYNASTDSVHVFVSAVDNRTSFGSVWNLKELQSKKGLEIINIDDVPAFKVIYREAIRFPQLSKDPSVNFNHQLLGNSFRARPTMSETADIKKYDMKYSFSDGSVLTVPWAAAHLAPGKFGDCSQPAHPNATRAAKEGLVHFSFTKNAEEEPQSIIDVKELEGHPDIIVVRVPDFMTNVTEQVEQKLKSFTKQQKLIVDLRNNGGGIVCQGFHLIELLTTKPPPILYDMRTSPGLDEIVAASTKNRSFDLFGPAFWDKPGTNDTYEKWYSPGRVLNRGGSNHNFSQLIQYPEASCIADGLKPPAQSRPFDEILLVTNGVCGSTCAIFSSLLSLVHDHVRTVAVGGVPQAKEMSFSTFPGGMVIEDAEIMSIFDSYNLNKSANRPHSFGTTASVRFAFLELYLSVSDTDFPEEFNFLPADHHIKFWPGADPEDTAKMYNMVAALFKTNK